MMVQQAEEIGQVALRLFNTGSGLIESKRESIHHGRDTMSLHEGAGARVIT